MAPSSRQRFVRGQLARYSGIPIRSQIYVTSSKIEPGTVKGSMAATLAK